jgi:hypothetical protein
VSGLPCQSSHWIIIALFWFQTKNGAGNRRLHAIHLERWVAILFEQWCRSPAKQARRTVAVHLAQVFAGQE